MRTGALRHCPTCGGVAENLGLRDYSTWLHDVLPGKAGGTDFDCVVERSGRFLALEFKPTRYVPRGQARTFDSLDMQGWTVYVVVDADLDNLQVGRWVDGAGVVNWYPMTQTDLAGLVLRWWHHAEAA